MPYISEELYQRLPKVTGTAGKSICVLDYPKDLTYRDETIEKQIEFVQKISGIVRSTRADYNLPNKTKTDLYIRVFDDAKLANEVRMYSDVLMSSAYANKIEVVEQDKDIPEGCAIVTVSDKCSAHLMLKGIIDPIKEVEKLGKKQDPLKHKVCV
jgi:valyl-tRNA synthetase